MPSKLSSYQDRIARKMRVRRYAKHTENVLLKNNSQILHSHFGNIGWSNTNLVKKLGIKHVVTFYGLDVNKLPTIDKRWFIRYKEMFQYTDRILCEGEHMASCIVDMGCAPDKVKVQRLGVEFDDLPFKPRIWKSGERLKILIAASFREKKGIPDALRAIAKVQDRLPISVSVIGDATAQRDDQIEKQKIMKVVKDNNLDGIVHFYGYRDRDFLLEQAYKHHIFMHPSITASNGDTEGGAPVCIIEMAKTGMPIISTKHCDIPGVVLEGKILKLASEKSVKDLTDILISYSENWDCLMGDIENLHKHVSSHFDCGHLSNSLYNQYRSLV